jgi:hypothetical protein
VILDDGGAGRDSSQAAMPSTAQAAESGTIIQRRLRIQASPRCRYRSTEPRRRVGTLAVGIHGNRSQDVRRINHGVTNQRTLMEVIVKTVVRESRRARVVR